MAGRARTAGIALGALLAIGAVVFVFVAPYHGTPGVRLGGTLTAAPGDWSTVNGTREMQLKPDGFPPFVVNIWFAGTPSGLITGTQPGGYWGGRIRANPHATVRIGDAAYEVKAREVLDVQARKELFAVYAGKYDLAEAGMTVDDLANMTLFFWTPR